MRSLILGTAGHIDHGKTELVRALTGVDTDRLKEEKERGITIDLGFAELPGSDLALGVVDVPGHEGFVRNMLAGATGMDVVLLVVAADEGVMPQTREHLAIVSLLRVQRLIVALTKVDLVEPAWLELVRDEVREALEATPFAAASIVPTSARTGTGIDELRERLLAEAGGAGGRDANDLTFLPIDRVFTVRGTGTVVTGTLWSGRLKDGDRVGVLPGGFDGRVRGLQVHGRDTAVAEAGSRVAVALGGSDMDREHLARGQALVTEPVWPSTSMLTARFGLLSDTAWTLEHNQRVRVHLGTAEVMARCVLFDDEPVAPGGSAWGQLRLEAPVATRAGQRAVLRSYSPVTTIGGAEVAEPDPPKRKHATQADRAAWQAVLEGDGAAAVAAAVGLAGPAGVARELVPVRAGASAAAVPQALEALAEQGGLTLSSGRVVGPLPVADTRARVLDALDRVHEDEPWRAGLPLADVRDAGPADGAPGLVDAVLERLVASGEVRVDEGMVARAGFEPRLTLAQQAVGERLAETYRDAGLQPPAVGDLPAALTSEPAFWTLLRGLERDGRLIQLEEGLFAWRDAVDEGARRVRETLAGRDGLGPTDFKEALPVSRRWLLPILAYFDRTGVTVRSGDGRSVAEGSPADARQPRTP